MFGILVKGFILIAAGLLTYFAIRNSTSRRTAMIAAVVVASVIALIFKGC